MYDWDKFKDIEMVHIAPGYDPEDPMVRNDLAVVKLRRPLEPRYVKPACFAYKEKAYNYSGDPLWVSLKNST